MASYNELLALIDAYINQNGVQAITGQVLNGVLRAMVDQLGRGYAIMGAADPTTDPGTPDGPETWFASVPGTYTNFDGIQIVDGELALLSYEPSTGFSKNTIYEGFQTVQATIDGNVGTPAVGVSYANGILSFDFHNMKGVTGDPAGFGAVTASVDSNIGTPSVQVQTSGPDTAKAIAFQFHNLKGETGVTSVLATVDNTSGNPQCAVSLNGQQLVLNFTGLKGAQGDTGSSVDYPFTIVNNLTTNDATQALSAAMGVQLESEVSQLEAKVDDISTGKYYGYYATVADLPDDATVDGFAYVGSGPTYTIYNCEDGVWSSSGITVNQSPVGNEEDIDQNASGKLQFANRTYNSLQPNGMGYKILRKDATFASQVTDTNTIYEIRYDFALTAHFTLPNNCVLLFRGGKIYGGNEVNLTANGCKIDGNKCISGICLYGASVLCSSWFIEPVSFKNSIISLLNNAAVYFDSDITLPIGVIYPPDGTSFYGKGDHTVSFEDTTTQFYVGNNCGFFNCNFDGTGSGKQEQDNHREIIRSDGKSNIKIVGCSFKNFYGGNRMIVIHLNNSDGNNAKENFVISDCVFDHYGSYNADDIGGDTNYVSRAIWISGNCKNITINNCKFSNQRNVSLSGEELSTRDADAVCLDGELNGDSYDMFAEISDNYFENIYTCPVKTFASYLIIQNNRSIQNEHCEILICRCYDGRNVQILNNSCVSSDERFVFVIQVKQLNNVTIANNRCETTATYAESALSLVDSTGIVVDGFSFIGKALQTEGNTDTEYLFGGSVYDDILIKNVVAVVGRRTAITRFTPAAHKITFDNVTIIADYVSRPFNSGRGGLVFEYIDCRFKFTSWGDSSCYAKVIAERCSLNFMAFLYGDGEFRNSSIYAVTTYGDNLKLINCDIPVFDRNLIYIASDAAVLIDGLNVGEKTSNNYYLFRVDGDARQNYVDIKNVNVLFAQDVSIDAYYLVKGNGSGFIRWGHILSRIANLTRGDYANIPSNTLPGFKYLATDADTNGGVYENVYGSVIKIS